MSMRTSVFRDCDQMKSDLMMSDPQRSFQGSDCDEIHSLAAMLVIQMLLQRQQMSISCTKYECVPSFH